LGSRAIPPLEVAIQAMRESLLRLESADLTQFGAFTHFSQFVTRSAQARNQFIREYTLRTGKRAKTWTAEMWTSPVVDAPVAELFHELREYDFHSEPFVIDIEEESVFAVPVNGTIANIKTGPARIKASQVAALFGETPGPHLRIYLSGTPGGQDGDPAEVVSYSPCYVLGSVSKNDSASPCGSENRGHHRAGPPSDGLNGCLPTVVRSAVSVYVMNLRVASLHVPNRASTQAARHEHRGLHRRATSYLMAQSLYPGLAYTTTSI
jgi:hypothetical protein